MTSTAIVRRARTIALLVIASMVVGWFVFVRSGPGRHHYAAVFTDASEVVKRNDVRLNDVIVGKVTGVALDGLHAKVDFNVDKDVALPAGTRAELRQVSLLGEQYLALIPEGEGRLRDGTTIPMTRTRRATDFEQLVGTAGELAANVAVGQVNQLVHGFTRAFGDDPNRLGRLLDATAAVSKTFNDHTPELQATIDRVEQMSAQLAPHSQEMAGAIDQLAAGMKALDDHRGDLGALTTNLARFSDRMAELLTNNEARLEKGLPAMRQVFGEIQGSLADATRFIDNLYGLDASWSCIGDGNFLNETFLLFPSAAYIDYGPGGCDPEKGQRSRNKQGQLVVEGVPGQQIDTSGSTGRSSSFGRVYERGVPQR